MTVPDTAAHPPARIQRRRWTFPACDPLPSDLVLLRCALGGDDAAAAWERWSTETDIDDHTRASYTLLPAAYLSLQRAGIEHRWMPRLKGVYRRQWTMTSIHESVMDAAASTLADHGVRTIRSPDHAIRQMMERPGSFPLRSARIGVPWNSTGNAHRALAAAGWTAKRPAPKLRGRLRSTSWVLERGNRTLHLSNHITPEIKDDDFERRRWQRALPADRLSQQLATSDLLFAALTSTARDARSLHWALGVAAVEPTDAQIADVAELFSHPATEPIRRTASSRLRVLASIGGYPWCETAAAQLDAQPIRRDPARPPTKLRRRARLVRRWLGPGRIIVP